MKTYSDFHGSPFDRGSADKWYSRSRKPHWFPNGTYNGEEITEDRMTAEEIEAYHAGYDSHDDHKDWG